MVNQNVQDAFKKFQDTKNNKHEMTQKQKMVLERTSTNTKMKQNEKHKMKQNFRKQRIKEILEIKSPFSQTKKHSGRPQQ
jgi:hypothetical protein